MNEQRWFVVPAAGFGERIGGVTPKQYLSLGRRCVLQVTLDQLLQVPDVQGIVVVLDAHDTLWSSIPASTDPRIHTCVGGDTRAKSVISGLEYVANKSALDTWVFVHDAARPLIDPRDIQRLSDAVFNSGAVGGILAARVQDTLKQADEYCYIERSISRESLWQAQTPQLFKLGALLDALHAAVSDGEEAKGAQQTALSDNAHRASPGAANDARVDNTDGSLRGAGDCVQVSVPIPITDEASAMEFAGHEPLLVEALQPNFKITRPVDLRIAAAILNDKVVGS